MPINRVVLNTSPLICLSKSELSELLLALFKDILVPDNVKKEVTAKSAVDFGINTVLSRKWLKTIKSIPINPTIAAWDLGEGENAVLSYVYKNPDHWAIIDDLQARRCAESLGCNFHRNSGDNCSGQKKGNNKISSRKSGKTSKLRPVALRYIHE
jgi:predicted nucleic acid-binding protein